MASGNDFTTKLGSALKCAICLDLYKDPRFLVCGHAFCYECLRGLIGPTPRYFRCPACLYTCHSSNMTKVFAFSDVVDVQKSISATTPPQHSCDLCKDGKNIDDLWKCDGCEVKMVCSKCMVKNGHGGKCDKIPRNHAEILIEKQNVLIEWCKMICQPGLLKLSDNIQSAMIMYRRILDIREIHKIKVSDQYCEAAIASIRAEMTAIQNLANPLIQMSTAKASFLDANLLECDKIMVEVANRVKALEPVIDRQLVKFQGCFAALDVLITSVRDVLDGQATDPATTDLDFATPVGDAQVNQPMQVDESIRLIISQVPQSSG